MSASEYVTVQMIIDHAKKDASTVRRALKNAGITGEKSKGVRGLRLNRKAVNKFIGRQWPAVGPMPVGGDRKEAQ